MPFMPQEQTIALGAFFIQTKNGAIVAKIFLRKLIYFVQRASLFLFVIAVFLASVAWTVAQDAIIFVVPLLVYFVTAMAVLLAIASLPVVYEYIRVKRAGLSKERTIFDVDRDRATLHLDYEKAMLTEQVKLMAAGLVSLRSIGGDATQFEQFKRNLLPDVIEDENILAPLPLLPAIADRERILIIGASDSGKTTLMRHMIDHRQNVLMIDPHGTPPKWGTVRHVGQGRDYRAIGIVLNWLVVEMTKRYEQLGSGEVGEGQHAPITIFIDEWRTIVKQLPDAGNYLTTLLTEGRKASISLIISSHSKMVKALGVEGEGDLRQGFSVVNLTGGNGSERHATLSISGGDEVEYSLPGAYANHDFTSQLTIDAPSILSMDVAPGAEQQVINEYLETASYAAAFRLLYKLENDKDYTSTVGGNQTQKVKDILDESGIKHPVK